MRLVIDAMVWLSALSSKNQTSPSRAIYEAWLGNEFTALMSGVLLDEIADTLGRAPFSQPPEHIQTFIDVLVAGTEPVAIRHQVMGVRDDNDNHVVEAAVIGRADYIVTRDGDLLGLPSHVHDYVTRHGIQIVRPEVILVLLGGLAASRATPTADPQGAEPQ